RQQMSIEQRRVFHQRHQAQEALTAFLLNEEERKNRGLKQRAAEKRAAIETAQHAHQEKLEARQQAILMKEAAKQAELQRKAEQVEDVRYEKQQNRLLQHGALRGRVQNCMAEMKSKLSLLSQSIEQRQAKVNEFERQNVDHLRLTHDMAVRTGLHKQSTVDSMRRMRHHVVQGQSLERLEMPPHIRANIQNEKLRWPLDRMDESGQGHISVRAMRDVLAKKVHKRAHTPRCARLPVSRGSPLPGRSAQRSRGWSRRLRMRTRTEVASSRSVRCSNPEGVGP
ncbi:MAG: hypothetical protein SGPRY_002109, partial [Prymnesium sp.]